MRHHLWPVAAAVALAAVTQAHAQFGGRAGGDYYGGYNNGVAGYRGYAPGFYYGYRPGYFSSEPPGLSIGRPSGVIGPGVGTGPYPGYFYPPFTPANPPPAAPAGAGAGAEESAGPPGEARLTVRLPAGAELWIDDYKSGQAGAVRTFTTPATLEPGKTYTYTLTAKWTENGRPVRRAREVPVRSGQDVSVDLTAPRP